MSTSPSSQCRWAIPEVEDRAQRVARLWAKATGRQVSLDHALRIARLSLPTDALLVVLTRASRPAIGSAWPALRSAELSYLQIEKAAEQSTDIEAA
jgi:hypothetical protein